jgi:hypothetical protein
VPQDFWQKLFKLNAADFECIRRVGKEILPSVLSDDDIEISQKRFFPLKGRPSTFEANNPVWDQKR